MLYAEWNLDEYLAVQREEAEHGKAIAVAKAMLQKGFASKDIADIAGLSIEQVQRLANFQSDAN